MLDLPGCKGALGVCVARRGEALGRRQRFKCYRFVIRWVSRCHEPWRFVPAREEYETNVIGGRLLDVSRDRSWTLAAREVRVRTELQVYAYSYFAQAVRSALVVLASDGRVRAFQVSRSRHLLLPARASHCDITSQYVVGTCQPST